jgi:hypothetical protein
MLRCLCRASSTPTGSTSCRTRMMEEGMQPELMGCDRLHARLFGMQQLEQKTGLSPIT